MNVMFVWTFWDVVQIVALLLFAIVILFFWVAHSIDEWRCKHKSGVMETSACDAICVQCGKNLGFIGTWRDREGEPVDRADAVNLARNIIDNGYELCNVTNVGAACLADAVLRMDAALSTERMQRGCQKP